MVGSGNNPAAAKSDDVSDSFNAYVRCLIGVFAFCRAARESAMRIAAMRELMRAVFAGNPAPERMFGSAICYSGLGTLIVVY